MKVNYKNQQVELTTGSDPELALLNNKGELISAQEVIPGSKREPFKTKHGSVQPDNIFAEFNSLACSSITEWVENHHLVLQDLDDILQPLDLQRKIITGLFADESLLQHPETRISGCNPDFNAYSPLGVLQTNRPANYQGSTFRGTGGHLHLGIEGFSNKVEDMQEIIRALDLTLGLPSVILDTTEGTLQRKDYYGQAGSFRYKTKSKFFEYNGRKERKPIDSYDGVEYRTLSAFWLASDKLMEFVYNGMVVAIENVEELARFARLYSMEIQQTINEGLKDEAIRFMDELGINYSV
jgi:hypothetical protein